ncbi:MAG: hypothetical protein ACOYS2_01830 [Patescibacteria group bacterium]
MKKYIEFSIILGMVFLAVFVLSGCNRKAEETENQKYNLTNEMQGKLDSQQAEINELQEKQNEQQKLEEEKNQQEAIANCEEIKKYCEQRLNAIGKEKIEFYTDGGTLLGFVEGDRNNYIAEVQKDIKKTKEHKKETEKDIESGEWQSNEVQRAMKNSIKHDEDLIEESENKIKAAGNLIEKERKEKNDLLNGKCKDYQNPCE